MMKFSTKWTSKSSATADAAPLSPEALRGRALALLARREHSLAELRAKLQGEGVSAQVLEDVLGGLVASQLQSDARFAEVFVRSRVQRGYGPLVIAQELSQRGVAAELVQCHVHEADWDWLEQAQALRQRRFGEARPLERKEQARQLRFLQYRGFSAGMAAKALRCPADD